MKNTGVRKVTREKMFSLLLDMDEHIGSMDEHLTSMDERLANVNERLTNVNERVTNMSEQVVEIKETMATKDDLENLREDLLKEIRPLHRAVDRDAKTIINHEKRIRVLEKHVVV